MSLLSHTQITVFRRSHFALPSIRRPAKSFNYLLSSKKRLLWFKWACPQSSSRECPPPPGDVPRIASLFLFIFLQFPPGHPRRQGGRMLWHNRATSSSPLPSFSLGQCNFLTPHTNHGPGEEKTTYLYIDIYSFPPYNCFLPLSGAIIIRLFLDLWTFESAILAGKDIEPLGARFYSNFWQF